MRLIREASNARTHLWRMQLWLICWPLHHMWRHWHIRCLLLQRMHSTREGCKPCLRSWYGCCCCVPQLTGAMACTILMDFLWHVLQRDGCPKIVNLGSAKTDLFYERKKYGFKKRWPTGWQAYACLCQPNIILIRWITVDRASSSNVERILAYFLCCQPNQTVCELCTDIFFTHVLSLFCMM